jgi:hypothetical protein
MTTFVLRQTALDCALKCRGNEPSCLADVIQEAQDIIAYLEHGGCRLRICAACAPSVPSAPSDVAQGDPSFPGGCGFIWWAGEHRECM